VEASDLIPNPERIEAGFHWHMIGLDSAKPPVNYVEANAAWTDFLETLKQRGLMTNGLGIPIDSPFLPEFVEQLKKWKRQGRYRPNGRVLFKLRQGEGIDWEWYELRPKKEIDLDRWKLECAADKIPQTVHMDRWGTCSERFKALVESHGLTGLDFLWVPDKGRYRAPQWYYAYSSRPVGRGFDHVFFDERKAKHLWSEGQFVKPEYRNGARSFTKAFFRRDASFGQSDADALVCQFDSNDLQLGSYGEFARAFLPNADFAYLWGAALTTVLCCNAHARRILVQNNILTTDEFDPIWIWDWARSGATMLDDPQIPCRLGHRFTPERWQAIRADVEKRWLDFISHPKPERPSDLRTTLRKLKSLREAVSREGFTERKPSEAMLEAEVARLPGIPPAWSEVLKTINGFFINNWEVQPLSLLADFHRELDEGARHMNPQLPTRLLHITSDGCGDWHSLDLQSVNEKGDCRVLEFDHEATAIRCEWPSIADFLHDMLASIEHESSEDD
jgi:hypothetical protein